MKKNGFTLAEVLITLAIIGVVATMTLPALMTNTQEQQAKTALKKGINTLTEAAQMNQAIDGFDYASLTEESDFSKPEAQSLYGLLSKRASIDYQKSGVTSLIKTVAGKPTDDTDNYAVFFRDGSAISFNKKITSFDAKASELQPDNLVYGIPILFDYNGLKGPNILSNCEGTTNGPEKESSENNPETDSKGKTEAAALGNLCSPGKRVIKDQFGIRLRGGIAVPNGPAARWTYEN